MKLTLSIFFLLFLLNCQSENNSDFFHKIDLHKYKINHNNNIIIQLDTAEFAKSINTIAEWIDNVKMLKMIFKDNRFEYINIKDLRKWLFINDTLLPKEYKQFSVYSLNEFPIKNENYWGNKFLVYMVSKTFNRNVKYFVVSKDYNIYLLGGFGINNINRLIRNEIGEIINDTVAYKLARFVSCYFSNEMFPQVIVDYNNYDSLKQIYRKIKLPKMLKYNDSYEFELYSIAYNEWHAIMKKSIKFNRDEIISFKVDTINKHRNN